MSRPQRNGVAWGSLALALLSFPLYMLLIDVPLLRSTGMLSVGLLALSVAAAVLATRGAAGRTTRIIAVVNTCLLAFFVIGFYTLGNLPNPQDAERTVAQAIDFTLPDQSNRPVSLRAASGAGPVLLVFYRGVW